MSNCKYYKQQKYVSYDGGFSWSAMNVYQKGALIESGSTDCGSPSPSYSGQYLTFVATESGTFKFEGNDINYSLDSGTTWTTLADGTNSPTVSAGQKIMWKATLTPDADYGIGIFSSTNNFTAEGNPMSLLYGDNFSGQTSLNGKSGAFAWMFGACNGLTSAENLSLPATTLANNCYNSMFFECGNLTTAPVLPATTLANNCYYQMFALCTSLNNVTCLATSGVGQYGGTSTWLYGVSSTGTFTKAANMNDWPSGDSGIPSGWTVVDYTS